MKTVTKSKPLDDVLDEMANATHTHSISEITNLQTALDGKAASSHTHTLNEISNYAAYDDSNCAKLNAYNEFTYPAITFRGQINQLDSTAGYISYYFGKSQLTDQCGCLNWYNGSGTPYITLHLYNRDGLLMYSNKIVPRLPIESSSTIVGSNVLANNETRLAAAETAIAGKASSSHIHTLSEITDYSAPDLSGYAFNNS